MTMTRYPAENLDANSNEANSVKSGSHDLDTDKTRKSRLNSQN